MAKTKGGKKIVPVKPHTRKLWGKTVKVSGHRRSTPDWSSWAVFKLSIKVEQGFFDWIDVYWGYSNGRLSTCSSFHEASAHFTAIKNLSFYYYIVL